MRVVSFIFALVVVMTGCSSGDSPVVTPPKTTVLVYILASDLERELSDINKWEGPSAEIKSMMQAKPSPNLNIVVQTGSGLVEYGDNRTDKPVKNFFNSKRHVITNNKIVELADLDGDNPVKTDMGLSSELESFMLWGVENFPADRYVIVFSSHSGGTIEGFGYAPASTMSIADMAKAFENVKTKKGITFELIGMNSCLMATFEFAYNVKNFAKYLVASENMSNGTGFNYAHFLDMMTENPYYSSADIGIKIVDDYISDNKDDFNTMTMSVTNLAEIENVYRAFDEFSEYAVAFFDKSVPFSKQRETYKALFTARRDTVDFNGATLPDMPQYFKILSSLSVQFKPYADNVANALKKAVVHSVSIGRVSNAEGLTFFFDSLMSQNNISKFMYINTSVHHKKLTRLLGEFIAHESSHSFAGFSKAPLGDGSYKTEITYSTDYGLYKSFVLMDMDDGQTDNIYFAAMPSVEVVESSEHIDKYKISAVLDKKIFSINERPFFLIPAGLVKPGSDVYICKMPIVFTPKGGSAMRGFAWANVNFNTGEADFVSEFLSEFGQVKKILPGDILDPLIASVDKASGEVTLTPLNNPFEISPDGVVFSRTDLPAGTNHRYAFYTQNLKAEASLSDMFALENAATTTPDIYFNNKFFNAMMNLLNGRISSL